MRCCTYDKAPKAAASRRIIERMAYTRRHIREQN